MDPKVPFKDHGPITPDNQYVVLERVAKLLTGTKYLQVVTDCNSGNKTSSDIFSPFSPGEAVTIIPTRGTNTCFFSIRGRDGRLVFHTQKEGINELSPEIQILFNFTGNRVFITKLENHVPALVVKITVYGTPRV